MICGRRRFSFLTHERVTFPGRLCAPSSAFLLALPPFAGRSVRLRPPQKRGCPGKRASAATAPDECKPYRYRPDSHLAKKREPFFREITIDRGYVFHLNPLSSL